jgi:hypothetical protein
MRKVILTAMALLTAVTMPASSEKTSGRGGVVYEGEDLYGKRI